MSYGIGWQTDDRYARRVRRATLSVAPHAPARRLAFTIEEGLRLASLPGENEGRCYYLRRLRLTGLPDDGDRQTWLQQFQRVLAERAAQAVHGADPRAAYANAVFFAGEQEALELLLRRVLARQTIHEWFWPTVIADTAIGHTASGIVRTSPTDSLICAIVEKLRARPASWLAVAAALFATAECDVVHLLGAIPPAVAERWIAEIRGAQAGDDAVQVPAAALSSIQQALRVFGLRSARTLWLATLAVLVESPAEIAAGTAVSSAERVLRRLSLQVPGRGSVLPSAPSRALSSSEQTIAFPRRAGAEHDSRGQHAELSFAESPSTILSSGITTKSLAEATAPVASTISPPEDSRSESSTIASTSPAALSPPEKTSAAASTSPAALSSLEKTSAAASTSPAALSSLEKTSGASSEPVPEVSSVLLASAPFKMKPLFSMYLPASRALPAPEAGVITEHTAALSDLTRAITRWHCEGLPTRAAGFFFLLNLLRHLGIAQALAMGLAPVNSDFVPRLLLRLAAHAGVAPDDPIIVWLSSLLTAGAAQDDLLHCDPSCWPANFQPARNTASVDYILRVWHLGVRRWCWRAAGLKLTDIVSRRGIFSVNRTDLDVSLPLDEADVRVRLAGLDLDPGWLPWFGRVVRFHYLERGEFDA
jgi:hypothetical protein